MLLFIKNSKSFVVSRRIIFSFSEKLRRALRVWRAKTRATFSKAPAKRATKDLAVNLIFEGVKSMANKTKAESLHALRVSAKRKEKNHRLILLLSKATNMKLSESFRLWRRLSKAKAEEKQGNCKILINSVRSLFLRKIRPVFVVLKQNRNTSTLERKTALKTLVAVWKDRQRIYWNQWVAFSQQHRIFEQRKRVLNLITLLNQSLAQNFKLILERDHGMEKKKHIIRMIIETSRSKMANAFGIWSAVCQQNAINDRVEEQHGMQKLTEIIKKILAKQKNNVDEAFKTLKLHRLKMSKFRDLLNNASHNTRFMLSHAFAILQIQASHSERKISLNSDIISMTLHSLYLRRVRSGFKALRNERLQEKIGRESIAFKFIHHHTASQRDFFIAWANEVRISKQREKLEKAHNLIRLLNSALKINSLGLLSIDPSKITKESAIKRVVHQTKMRIRAAFDEWKMKSLQVRLAVAHRQMRYQNASQELSNRFSKVNAKLARAGFEALKTYNRELGIKRRALLGLLSTRAGLLFYAFEKWKTVPSKKRLQKPEKSLEFYAMISRLFVRRIKHSFELLKEEWHAANNLKIICIKQIFTVIKRRERYYWTQWAEKTRNAKRIESYNSTHQAFEVLNSALRDNIKNVLDVSSATNKKAVCMRLLVQSLKSNLSQAFLIWKNLRTRERIQEKLVLRENTETLKRVLLKFPSLEERTKRYVFNKLKSALLIELKKKRAISRIFRNQQYKLRFAFQQLKNNSHISEIRHQAAVSITWTVLKRLLQGRLRFGFNKLKRTSLFDSNLKQMVLKKIITAKENQIKEAFQIWAEAAQHAQRWNKVTAAFTITQTMLSATQKNLASILKIDKISKSQSSSLILSDKLQDLIQRRMRLAFNILRQLPSRQDTQITKIFEMISGATMNKLRIAFLSWKNQKSYLRKEIEEVATHRLLKVISLAHRAILTPVFLSDQPVYGKKIILKKLYHSWSTREADAFQRWKESVRKERLLATALNFAKLIIKCENNKRYVMRQALKRWKDKDELVKFTSEQATTLKHNRKLIKIDNLSLLLTQIYYRKLLQGFYSIRRWSSNKRLGALLMSRIQCLVSDRLAESFDYLRNHRKSRVRTITYQNAHALAISVDKLYKTRLLTAFTQIRLIKYQQTVLKLAFGKFNTRLHDAFQRWRNAVGYQKQAEIHENIEQQQKKFSLKEKAPLIGFLLRTLVNKRKLEGFHLIEAKYHRTRLINSTLRRMDEVTKCRLRNAFEIWQSQSNQKVIKQFYDLVLLEKALDNYTNSLKAGAFHALKTTALIDVEKSYVVGLWKWRLFTTEAKYESIHEKSEKKASALARMCRLIEQSNQVSLRWSFKKISNLRLRSFEMKTRLNYLVYVMKAQLSRYLWCLKLNAGKKNVESLAQNHKNIVPGLKTAKVAILSENRALSHAFYNWVEICKEHKHLEAKSKLVERNYAQRQKWRAISDWKSFHRESLQSVTNETKVESMSKILDHSEIKTLKQGFECLRNHQAKRTRQEIGLTNLQSLLLDRSVRKAFNKWARFAKYEFKLQEMRLSQMVKVFHDQNQVLLKEAFSLWRESKSKYKTTKGFKILENLLLSFKRQAFNTLVHHAELSRQKDHIHAINKLIRLNQIFEQAQKYQAFKEWRDSVKPHNPWFLESLRRIARYSKINYQIAFWRLVDSVQENRKLYTEKNIEKMKKIFFYVSKHYLMTVGKAFWAIEKFGRLDEFSSSDEFGTAKSSFISRFKSDMSFDPNQAKHRSSSPSADVSFHDQSRSFVSFGTKPATHQGTLIERGRLLALKMILNKYDANKFDRRERLSEAFKLWKIRTPGQAKLLLKNLHETVKPNDMSLIAKHGAIELMAERINMLLLQEKRAGLNHIKEKTGMVSQLFSK